MTDQSEGHRLHVLEEEAREAGNFIEALKLSDEALVAYLKDEDSAGTAEILAARMLILRHLYENSQTENKNLLIYAKHEASAAVEIAEATNRKEALAIPYFNLAKILETLENFREAFASYQKAVELMENFPPEQHKRIAVISDFKNHMYCCEYKLGNKEAVEKAKEVIKQIEAATDEPDYNRKVWASGGHMRIAEVIAESDQETAQKEMSEAKKIIDSDERLKIREKQWHRLNQKLGFE